MAEAQGIQGGRVQVGIVVRDLDPMVVLFYTDVLGMQHVGDLALPSRDGRSAGVLKRFVLGDSGLKLLSFGETPPVTKTDPTGRWAAPVGSAISPLRSTMSHARSRRVKPSGCRSRLRRSSISLGYPSRSSRIPTGTGWS